MSCCTTVALCLFLVSACSGLILERLPRHIPTHKDPPASVDKRKIDPNELSPFSDDQKREAKDEEKELVDILKDEDEKHSKTKRQSDEEEAEKPNPDFQDWLRREYYRNMAKSFASMRRKRDGSRREKRSKKSVSFEEVTDNLRTIEDFLFLDALKSIQEPGDEDVQRRISNDLSSAYDIETMRNALFRLKDNLRKKRGDQCAPLELLTSDCSSLGDIVPDGPLKRLLLHACNWHEVCYTCGEVFGLTSENCDVGFVEQSQTICRGDVPCESTASMLLLPLRQRRVFYKRSNPNVCLMDSCVEDFLRQV